VFAHLVHTRLDAVLTFLSSLPGPTGKPVLEFLMTEWVAKQNNFVGSYEVKVSILALAKILEHVISTEDARFKDIFVKGDRIINPVEGIKTRSKTKNGTTLFRLFLKSFFCCKVLKYFILKNIDKELYTQVPLLVKIYKLLINEVHGLLEEKADEAEDYDEEEEGEDGDEDEDENEDKVFFFRNGLLLAQGRN
jgi:hypothetical protein